MISKFCFYRITATESKVILVNATEKISKSLFSDWSSG